jgi:hypothetical protein
MKLPTISCMPEDTGQYLVIVTDVVDIRGPSESVIEHVRWVAASHGGKEDQAGKLGSRRN